MLRLLIALLQVPSPNLVVSTMAAGQMRFLVAHMRVELAGCLYGRVMADTTYVDFFVSGMIDPRLAADSTVPQGSCPRIDGVALVGIAHSHIRRHALCMPSGKDQTVLAEWRLHGARLGAIICGDSLALFSATSYGILFLGPLDSLYRMR